MGAAAAEVELVAERLLQYGHPWRAIELLAARCREDDERREVTPSLDLAQRVLRAALRVQSTEIGAGAAVGVLPDPGRHTGATRAIRRVG
jgi:hypothetical protein